MLAGQAITTGLEESWLSASAARAPPTGHALTGIAPNAGAFGPASRFAATVRYRAGRLDRPATTRAPPVPDRSRLVVAKVSGAAAATVRRGTGGSSHNELLAVAHLRSFDYAPKRCLSSRLGAPRMVLVRTRLVAMGSNGSRAGATSIWVRV
jgi:hypothetical protein